MSVTLNWFPSELLRRDDSVEAGFASERATFPRSFGNLVPVLHHQTLAPKREHRRVYSAKSDDQPIAIGNKLP